MRIKLVYLLMFGILCVLNIQALGVSVDMNANNGGNTSSFNQNVNWGGIGGPPAAGNAYSTGGYLMRSPANGSGYLTGDFTFAGDSLTVGYSSTGTNAQNYAATGYANNNALLFKLAQQTLTVPNLIMDAGDVRDGLSDGSLEVLAGNMYVTPNGSGFACQALLVVQSAISGPGPIYIGTEGNVYTDCTHRSILFGSAASTYQGNIIFNSGNTTVTSQLCLLAGSVMNFAPTANGVTNSISGLGGGGMLTANGTFNIITAGADTTLGNVWQLVGPGVVPPTTNIPAGEPGGMLAMYEGDAHLTGSTAAGNLAFSLTGADSFNVAGFTNEGNGYWAEAIPASPNYFVFNESNGTLDVQSVVPEPATCIMLVLAAMGIAFYSRKK